MYMIALPDTFNPVSSLVTHFFSPFVCLSFSLLSPPRLQLERPGHRTITRTLPLALPSHRMQFSSLHYSLFDLRAQDANPSQSPNGAAVPSRVSYSLVDRLLPLFPDSIVSVLPKLTLNRATSGCPSEVESEIPLAPSSRRSSSWLSSATVLCLVLSTISRPETRPEGSSEEATLLLPSLLNNLPHHQYLVPIARLSRCSEHSYTPLDIHLGL